MSWKKRVVAAVFLSLVVVATDVWAVVGRPATPVSYAGVARRTSRRSYGYGGAGVGYGGAAVATGVAVGATVAALPSGCPYSGSVYRCGGSVYRPVYDGPNVVYVVE